MKLVKRLKKNKHLKPELRNFTADKSLLNHCPCCGEEYRGNYCPVCGLPTGKGDITWKSIKEGVMDLWGLGTRSLPLTLWQLMLMPGHLIAAYISGRRQISFPPVKMLVILSVIALLIYNLIDFSDNSTVAAAKPGDVESMINYNLNLFYNWALSHFDWALLVYTSFLIVPTWVVFRYSPRCHRHNLPQGFFIQVFNSMQMLIVIMLVTVLTWALDLIIDTSSISQETTDTITNAIVYTILLALIYRTYYQIFGYNAWGTAWRVAAVLAAGYGTMGIVFFVLGYSVAAAMGKWNYITSHLLSDLIFDTLLTTIALVVPHLINRRSKRVDPIKR